MTTPAPARSPRFVSAGPVLLFLAGAAAALSLVLDLRVPESHRELILVDAGWTAGLPGVTMAWAGALILARDRRHRLGWVLGIWGLWWAVDGLAAAWLGLATLETPAAAGASAAFWVYQRLGAGLLLVLPLVLVLYPDGRLPDGRRLRALAVAGLAAIALLPLVLVAVPARIAQDVSGDGAFPEPFDTLDLDLWSPPLPDGVWVGLLRASYLGLALGLVPAFAVVVQRYRRSRGRARARMQWLLWAAVVDLTVMLTIQVLPDELGSWGLTIAVMATSVSVAVGVVRPDLVDVDRLLGGTLVYVALLAATLAVDLAVLGVVGTLLGERLDGDQAFVMAAFVVAVVYAPLRHQLWRLVRVRLLGERDDPYTVVASLARRLEDSAASDTQLLVVAEAVADAFRVPYVGVELRQSNGAAVLAEHGERPSATRALPITYRDERIGRLLLPEAGPRARLRPADERLLADVVRQAAAAARADELAAELQHSRERLVTAVEDERRRLRRELHDGLGPALAAVATRIDTARLVAARDPDAAARALGQARQEVTGLLGEVRRLVHGLRPPALDDVGLVRALGRLAEQVAPATVDVRVEAPEELAGLPAAVEVAAYRIAAEALTNVVRHAGASRCRVRLVPVQGALVVEVEDDGCGIDADVRSGVGLLSLRERAEELGGRAEVTPGEGGQGTRVRAVLPLPAEAANGPDSPTLAAPAAGLGAPAGRGGGA